MDISERIDTLCAALNDVLSYAPSELDVLVSMIAKRVDEQLLLEMQSECPPTQEDRLRI